MIHCRSRRATLIAVLCAVARTASAQLGGSAAPLTTVTLPKGSDFAPDTSHTLVVVVRNLRTPDRPIEHAVVTLEPANGSHTARRGGWSLWTGPMGDATFADLNTDVLGVTVRQLGFDPVHVVMTISPRCRRTLEVYIEQTAIHPEQLWEKAPPTNPGRAVLTTCAPPPDER